MSMKELEIIRLEDRVLFEAAAAAEIVEAQQNDPNADMNHTDQQAQDEKNALKNAPPENLADAVVEPGVMPQPDKVGDIDAEIQALIEGEIGFSDAGADAYADAINGLVNDFGADAVNDTIHDAFAPKDIPLILTNSDANLSVGIERELVIISADVENTDALIASLGANQEVLVLEDGDAMAQIKNYLDANGETYKAIHLVARGNSGYLVVNGEVIDSSNFNAADWADIGSHITDDGDILLYSDNLAANEAGRELAGMIADASGADVTANSGLDHLSGSYALDFQTGNIEATVLSIDGSGLNLTSYTVNGEHHELVIINSSVKDADQIAAQFADGTDFLYLEASSDPLAQINAYLAKSGATYDAIRIFSHGNAGFFTLSGRIIDSSYVAANSDAFTAMGSHLTADGDLMLYGCNLAANDAGKLLVNELAAITGADVAASTDTTGLGGNWDLEYQVGTIQAAGFTINNYSYRLTTLEVTNNLDDNTTAGSLRVVIASAAATGDDIAFRIVGSDEIILSYNNSAITITNKTFTINGYNNATTNNITIKVATTYQNQVDGLGTANTHRLFVINGSSNITFENMTLKGGSFTGNGGAIDVSGTASLTLDNVAISESRATAYGGAVSITGTGALTIKNGSNISGNYAANGGAIYSTSKLIIGTTGVNDNVTFSKNTLTGTGSGGAIYSTGSIEILGNGTKFTENAAGAAGAIQQGGAILTISGNNTIFSKNTAIYAGYGGAIYCTNGSGVFTISGDGTQFNDNYAERTTDGKTCGGAIFLNGKLYITGDDTVFQRNISVDPIGSGTFKTPHSGANAGAIYASASSIIEITGSNTIFKNNKADNYGGAIWSAGSVKITGNTTFDTNYIWGGVGLAPMAGGAAIYIAIRNTGQAGETDRNIYASEINNTTFIGNISGSNTSTGYGGAVLVHTSKVTFTNCTFTSNTAKSHGGAISGGAWDNPAGPNADITVENCTFTTNTAANGGAISSYGGKGVSNITISNSTFTGNKATASGGAIHNYANGTVTFDDDPADDVAGIKLTSFTNNTAASNGGAIYSVSTLSGLEGIKFTNNTTTGNTSSHGGAIWTNKSIALNGCEFTLNSAKGNGGAIFASGSGVTITLDKYTDSNSVVTYTMIGKTGFANSAVNGAGIYLDSAAKLVINNNSVISYNTASTSGGGVYVAAANSTITSTGGGIIDHNNATNGGGLYTAASITLGANLVITNNTATSGGAVYATASGNTLTISGITIGGSGNANTALNGGGIYLAAAAKLALNNNAAIAYNTATAGGGGVYIAAANSSITGTGSIDHNGAVNGAGVCTLANLTLPSTIAITNNTTTGNGGGVYASGTSTTLTIQGTIGGSATTGNSAAKGGGVYLASGAKLTLTSATLSYNNATADGGGLYMETSASSITNGSTGSVTNNTSGDDGAGIWTAAALTVTNSLNITANTATGNGGGIYASGSSATVTLQSTTLTGNEAGNGGGIALASAAKLVLSSGTVSGNNATADGGGIYAESTTSTITGTGSVTNNTSGGNGAGIWTAAELIVTSSLSITGNTATGNGGGIYASGSSAAITLKDVLNGNKATNGGGIVLADNASLTMDGGTISNNIATADGGGIYAKTGALELNSGSISNNYAGSDTITSASSTGGNGGGIWSAVALTIGADVSVTGNTARANASGENGLGGGIYSSANVTLTGATINENKAENGGGIYMISGTLSMTGATISDNEAIKNGGGIYMAGGTLSMTGSTISDNTAGVDGGGIYLTGPALISTMETVTVSGNEATNNGGGIYQESDDAISLTMNNVTISNNTAGNNGGGIMLSSLETVDLTINGTSMISDNSGVGGGGIYVYGEDTITLNIGDGTNAVTFADNNADFGGGGAIYVLLMNNVNPDASVDINIASGSLFDTNHSTTHGGAIVISADEGAVNIDIAGTGTVFTGNNVGDPSSYGQGGVFYLQVGKDIAMTIGDGTKFTSNWAQDVGGVLYLTGDNITLDIGKNVLFEGNQSTEGIAGAIYACAGSENHINIGAGTIFKDNYAELRGGAVFAVTIDSLRTTWIDLDNVTFTGNIASKQDGGAIYTDGDVTAVNSVFTSNRAGRNGGAMFLNIGIADITGGSFTNNIAENNGGAIYLGYLDDTLAGTSIITGTQFLNNKAVNGGAIWSGEDGALTVNGGIFGAVSGNGNTATTGNGGAIYAAGTLTVGNDGAKHSEFYHNTAGENGGAIYAKHATVNGAIFGATGTSSSDNTAKNGGAIHADTLTVDSAQFYRNTATENGGAIYAKDAIVYGSVFGAATATTAAATVGNSAANGGAIFALNTLTVSSNTAGKRSEFYRNKATENGGAIYLAAQGTVSGSIFGDASTSSSGNTASENGGAIYAAGALTINTVGSHRSEFYRNTATGNGGAVYGASTVAVNGALFGSSTVTGSGNTAGVSGGAVYGSNTVTINDSNFAYNTAKQSGGAVYATGTGKLTVSSSNFTYNESYYGNSGGAIYTLGAADIFEDYFAYNTAHSGNGGAAYVGGNLNMELTTMIHNTATTGSGGAVWAGGTSVSMRNSLIADNTAAVNGGGIYLNNTAVVASLVNLTIANNTASTGNGGGIYAASGSNVLVANSILWGNKANNAYNQSANIANADFFFSAIQGWTGAHEERGNINLQAANSGKNEVGKYYIEFENPTAGNYKLASNSYAINRGNNSYVLAGETDLVKAVRIFNEANGGRVDMGAYESNLKGNVVVVMDPIQDIVYGDNGTLTAGRDGYGTGGYHYSSGNTNYVTVSGDQATAIKAKGNGIVMTAFYDGDDNWNQASGTETVNTLVRIIEIQTEGGTYEYDGKYHEFTWDPNAVGGRGFAFTDTITSVDSPAYRNVGTHVDELNSVVITNASNVKMNDNYDIRIIEGTMIITKADLEITAQSDNRTYDGKYHGYTWGAQSGLKTGDYIIETNSYSFRDANTYDNILDYVVLEDADGNDMSGNYNISFVNGTVVINKIQLTITAQSDDRTYDGKYHDYSWGSYTGNLADGDDITEANSYSFRDAGTYDTILDYAVIKNANGEDMANNYDITFVDGTVVIHKAQLTITAQSDDRTYDGKHHDYSWGSYTGDLADGDKITGSNTYSFRDANTYDTILDYAVIRNSNGEDIAYNYDITFVDGTVVIHKAQLTVTAESDHITYNGEYHDYSWADWSGNMADGDDITEATVNYFRKAGTHDNVLDYVMIRNANGEDVAYNYDITFVDGIVIIDKAQLIINLDGVDKVYDGTTDGDYNFNYDPDHKPFNGDDVHYDKGTATFTDRNAGNDKTLVINGDSLYGDDLDNYDVIINDPTASITPARLIIVIDDKSKQENQADPKFTGTPTGLADGDTVSDYNRTNKGEREGKYAIDQYQLNDGNNGRNYIVEVHNGTLTIIGEARINIYKDASSRNYIVDGQDEFSLMHQVTILGINRDADAILDTETGGNHHGTSHQSMHKAGDKARNNLREGSLKVMFEQHDANMTIRDNRSALSRSDVFSSGSEKNGVADSQVVNAKKDAASSLSSGRGGVSQVQSVSDRSLDFTSESTHPMNNMPSSISLETLENSVNFSANVEMTDAVWQEKVECLKSKLDLVLEEMMLV